jgi:hypothetical protein
MKATVNTMLDNPKPFTISTHTNFDSVQALITASFFKITRQLQNSNQFHRRYQRTASKLLKTSIQDMAIVPMI